MKALNFSSTSKTLGAIEMQLLCPLHLSLSMIIFISPPFVNPQLDRSVPAASLDKVRHRSRRALPADKSIHIDPAAPAKDLRPPAIRSHDPKTRDAPEPARPLARRKDSPNQPVVRPKPPTLSPRPQKTRQNWGRRPACEAEWNCAS